MKETIILGVTLNKVNKNEALIKIYEFIEQKDNFRYLVTPNPEIILKSLTNEDYLKILNKSDLELPDGVGLWFAGVFLGSMIKERITGREITKDVINFLDQKGYSLCILLLKEGLSSKSEVQDFFRKKYPKIKLDIIEVNKKNINLNDLKQGINTINPHVILSALGAQLQEEIIYNLKKENIKPCFAMCVGGSVDYLLGKQTIPPKIFEKLGLEWLWRLFKMPNRRNRIFNAVIVFPYQVIKWKLRMIFKYRHTVVGCIINKQKQILIGHLSYLDEWGIPQGGVDGNEKIEQTVLREMYEELGIEKKYLNIIFTKENIYKYKWPKWAKLGRGYKGQRQSLAIIEFTGKEDNIKPEVGDEIDNYHWVDIDNVCNYVSEFRKESADIVVKLLNNFLK